MIIYIKNNILQFIFLIYLLSCFLHLYLIKKILSNSISLQIHWTKLYHDIIERTSMKFCIFPLKAIVTFIVSSIGSHASRKKNFRFVVMPVVCAPVIKFAVAPGPSTGQSSLQNSNLITPAFESGTKDGGEKERERIFIWAAKSKSE